MIILQEQEARLRMVTLQLPARLSIQEIDNPSFLILTGNLLLLICIKTDCFREPLLFRDLHDDFYYELCGYQIIVL